MVFALANHVSPAAAYEWFGIVFAVVILGGSGQPPRHPRTRASASGSCPGWCPRLVAATEPIALFVAIILALVLRPQGLFTLRSVVGAGR